MCVVSMIGDHYTQKYGTYIGNTPINYPPLPSVSDDIQALRRDILEMKELLKKAIAYDRINNQPECHKEEKIAALRKLAELAGVDLSDVLAGKK